ncbi:hypothetical protein DFH11DRAFT_1619082 [Phellopilus nigrolimitatus]|nr:hypothetical protein DFH11DRAFT_1619082 [Phellopilus nigrolimitatus]
MAPNFLSKFVKSNGSLASPDHSRSRTSSDASASRARTIDTAGLMPKLVLTDDDSNSPVQPSTPGSLHRQDSTGARRTRSASLTASDRTRPTPTTPRIKAAEDITDTPRTSSSDSALSTNAAMGLGVDLGQPAQPPSGLPKESSSSNGFESIIRRKLSSKSLKSLKSQTQGQSEEVPPVPSVYFVPPEQEVVAPPRPSSTILVDSPTSDDATPTTSGFPTPSEIDAAGGPLGITPSMSTSTMSSLQPHSPDADAVSISSSKKMPWRQSASPPGLASAIAASGLSMANPAVTHSLAHFAPPQPPSPPPTRAQIQSPSKRSVSGGATRRSSNGSRVRSRAESGSVNMEDGSVNGDHFYSDVSSDSEDELDLEEDIPVTGFAVASSKRNADFHDMFPDVPEGDYLIEDYGCALQREILIQGRLYISENHICFHANIFGWITDLTIPVYEVASIERKMTALFIPNAIQITTRTAKYAFASFLSRDTTYDVMHNVWRLARPDAESIRSGDASARISLDDQMALMPNGDSSSLGTSLLSPVMNKVTECKCGKEGTHYPETAMSATFPGTPEKIYNLMFASGFIKEFMRVEQDLRDLQISDWCPDPETNLLSRKFSYIKILNGVVKQTKCELLDETLYCDFDDYICTLTTTRTPDVPSGGAFAVKTRTCIMWASPVTTKVIVTTQVDWTGRSFIKSLINGSALDGQKKYHIDLEHAMRQYIAQHKNEFIPEGMEGVVDVVEVPAVVEEAGKQDAIANTSGASLTEEEANKRREHERNQRATQWAFDTMMGAWKVAKQSTLDALDLVGDAWDQSSSTTILIFVIVVLVLSNLWTLVMVGRREEVGRRKEMIKIEEQRKWVSSIVSAIWEERQTRPSGELVYTAISSPHEDWREEAKDINKALDLVEERLQYLRRSLHELD